MKKLLNKRRKKNVGNTLKGIITAGQGVTLSEGNLKQARVLLTDAIVSMDQINKGGKVLNIALVSVSAFLILKIAGVNDGY